MYTCSQCSVVFDRSQELDEHLRRSPQLILIPGLGITTQGHFSSSITSDNPYSPGTILLVLQSFLVLYPQLFLALFLSGFIARNKQMLTTGE